MEYVLNDVGQLIGDAIKALDLDLTITPNDFGGMDYQPAKLTRSSRTVRTAAGDGHAAPFLVEGGVPRLVEQISVSVFAGGTAMLLQAQATFTNMAPKIVAATVMACLVATDA